MTEDDGKAFRKGIALALEVELASHMYFNPGNGMSPMEFRVGSHKRLKEKLDNFVETGKFK